VANPGRSGRGLPLRSALGGRRTLRLRPLDAPFALLKCFASCCDRRRRPINKPVPRISFLIFIRRDSCRHVYLLGRCREFCVWGQ
jgi:hypothetical protein